MNDKKFRIILLCVAFLFWLFVISTLYLTEHQGNLIMAAISIFFLITALLYVKRRRNRRY